MSVVLVAHGSRDPRSANAMRRLAASVGAVAAFLDFNPPTVPTALRAVGGSPVVVPALLTHAYHGRVDVPRALASVGPGVAPRLAPVLGPSDALEEPHPLLLAALRRRLAAVEPTKLDGVVLIAAGTTDPMARSTVEQVAARLGPSIGVRCSVGYATAAGSGGFTPSDAVTALRDDGARRVVAVSYFLAPGRLHDAAVAAALAGGAVTATAPLAGTAELASLVRARVAAVVQLNDLGLTEVNGGDPRTPVSPRSV